MEGGRAGGRQPEAGRAAGGRRALRSGPSASERRNHIHMAGPPAPGPPLAPLPRRLFFLSLFFFPLGELGAAASPHAQWGRGGGGVGVAVCGGRAGLLFLARRRGAAEESGRGRGRVSSRARRAARGHDPNFAAALSPWQLRPPAPGPSAPCPQRPPPAPPAHPRPEPRLRPRGTSALAAPTLCLSVCRSVRL